MFYPIWEAASLDEWLYNGGPYQLIVCHFLLGVYCYMGREWELSYRLGMRPWIAVAYSAPVAAASAVFLVYPIGQGSFSDGMPLGKYLPFPFLLKSIFFKFYLLKLFQLLLKWIVTRLKGKSLIFFLFFLLRNIRKSFEYIRFFSNNSSGNFLDSSIKDRELRSSDWFIHMNSVVNTNLVRFPTSEREPFKKKYINKNLIPNKNNKKNKTQESEDSLSNPILLISSTEDEYSHLFKETSVCEEQKEEIQKTLYMRPTKKPGVYMIHCITNDKRYYGETSNISDRLSSHRSMLRRKIHFNFQLQHDWNTYSEDQFHFIPLFVGEQWNQRKIRLQKELSLILDNVNLCYNDIYWYDKSGNHNPFSNRKHTEETKQKIALANSRPNDTLGKSIQLNGVNYPSLAEASRQTGMARKTIRQYLNDPNNLSCTLIE